MSFDSLLTDPVHVEIRTPETDSWERLTERPIRMRITALPAEQARQERELLQAAITHRGRARPHEALQQGRYLRHAMTGKLFRIRALREHPAPSPDGQVILSLEIVE